MLTDGILTQGERVVGLDFGVWFVGGNWQANTLYLLLYFLVNTIFSNNSACPLATTITIQLTFIAVLPNVILAGP